LHGFSEPLGVKCGQTGTQTDRHKPVL